MMNRTENTVFVHTIQILCRSRYTLDALAGIHS
jgi:hypothetical protein